MPGVCTLSLPLYDCSLNLPLMDFPVLSNRLCYWYSCAYKCQWLIHLWQYIWGCLSLRTASGLSETIVHECRRFCTGKYDVQCRWSKERISAALLLRTPVRHRELVHIGNFDGRICVERNGNIDHVHWGRMYVQIHIQFTEFPTIFIHSFIFPNEINHYRHAIWPQRRTNILRILPFHQCARHSAADRSETT